MRRLLRHFVLFAVLGAVGAALVAWSGVYNVAATRGHFRITELLLEFVMRRSVRHHSGDVAEPALDDAMAERAVGHFHSSCAPCHGAPGLPPHPVTRGMLPHPPDLSAAAPSWRTRELFWIVRHGIKYTGMPGWPVDGRDDEVWAMVAFLRRLPALDAEGYRRVTAPPVPDAAPPILSDLPQEALCSRCHGAGGEGSSLGAVPRLAGQRADYLAHALDEYASGTRRSGIMHLVALALTPEKRRALAQYYAALPAAGAAPQGADAALVGRGEALARDGAPGRMIPPCQSCHGGDGRAQAQDPRYPALAGLQAAYLEPQLRMWRSGGRGGLFSEIMAAAARDLSDEDIRALAAYYSSLPAGR